MKRWKQGRQSRRKEMEGGKKCRERNKGRKERQERKAEREGKEEWEKRMRGRKVGSEGREERKGKRKGEKKKERNFFNSNYFQYFLSYFEL